MVHVSERLFSESVKLKRCKGYNCVFTVKTEVTLLLCCRVLYHLPQACFHRNYPGKACPSIPCLPIKAFLLVSENSWDMVRPMKGSFLQAPHYLCSQNWRKVEKLWGGDRWCCPVSFIRSFEFLNDSNSERLDLLSQVAGSMLNKPKAIPVQCFQHLGIDYTYISRHCYNVLLYLLGLICKSDSLLGDVC